MASSGKLPSKLLDCHFFYGGGCNNGEGCRYRHSEAAKQTTDTCPKWLEHYSCTNFDCEYRHPTPVKRNSSPIVRRVPTPPRPAPVSVPPPQRSDREGIVAFFWDYENCHIPTGLRAFDVVRRLKERFVLNTSSSLVGFSCYCDVTMLNKAIIDGLQLASVDIIQTSGGKQNTVDRKIFIDLDTFAAAHRGEQATVILISGDIDFVSKLDSLRCKSRFRVIVLHNSVAKSELLDTADEHYLWSDVARGEDTISSAGPVSSVLPHGLMQPPRQRYPNSPRSGHPRHPIRPNFNNRPAPQQNRMRFNGPAPAGLRSEPQLRSTSTLLQPQPVPNEASTPREDSENLIDLL